MTQSNFLFLSYRELELVPVKVFKTLKNILEKKIILLRVLTSINTLKKSTSFNKLKINNSYQTVSHYNISPQRVNIN